MPDTPTFTTVHEAEALAWTYYGLKGTAKKLNGEIDFNFQLLSDTGQAFTLKLSRPEVNWADIDFQHNILHHLSQSGFPLQLPEPLLTSSGEAYARLEGNRALRLQSWIEGRVMAAAVPRSPELLNSWGQACGLLSKHLEGFDHPTAHRFYKWNPSEALAAKQLRPYIRESQQQAIADYFWDLFEQEALPHLPALRKNVNYNDAHELNLLVNEDAFQPKVSGIIDFGDALYTETINELAIACAYACMNMPDPLEAAGWVVQGYHEVFPIQEAELAVLFPLITARLLISVANSAYNKHLEPENDYLQISEAPAWDLLEKWRKLSPALAHYRFREICGFRPCPKQSMFEAWLEKEAPALGAVLDLTDKRIARLDLSVSSVELGHNSHFEHIQAFDKTIARLLEVKAATVGMGGYGEIRPFYTTDAYAVSGNNGAQWRTVHLGMDVWMAAETPIYAPLEGVVFSVSNNAGERDYGPTLILKHEVHKDLVFYTLYGHLSAQVLDHLQAGDLIEKGQAIAAIGPAPINGNWPPHLHFQLILDMMGNTSDFPGVAFPAQQATWLSVCPDPAPFFPKIPAAKSALKQDEILEKRQKHLGKSLSISYQDPLHIVRGYQTWLYDTTGRRYLDTVNNVPHVGHQHPKVVKAAQRQMELLNTNTRYLHEEIVLLAEALLATLPAELSVVHFVNSGSEANELALRMAQTYTGQTDMIVLKTGYHGNTNACVAISSYKFDGKGGKGAPEHIHVVPTPDTYRGMYVDENAGEKYAEPIRQTIQQLKEKGKGLCGFICESILSCAGQIVLPKGYLPEAYQQVQEAGGVCIADEVQTGIGRVGDAFWGFELQGVVPDIVTIGKPIGNGHPLGAVVCTRAIADAFANGMEYFNTFGGNPVSCAIGRTVLQVVQEEGLQAHAKKTGDELQNGLRQLQKAFPIIGDVRGHGLFLGFELVKDPKNLTPATREATHLANRMRACGILMSTDGPYNNVLKIKPPMCFGKPHADYLLDQLSLVLREDVFQI
ncbi:MAG TPA: aminotransferase class III-fold pyridoxal phosphate-dependent enzyme [Saprospiraceae bacterium]|nr:aminotransferase class III-fold pyridoxal phosphate-dependent enzyme [Saprospiraceae bacterium]HMQ85026.1 aminotransferase class III-fold pyridoxal phosphate-dependent enzyme [Saprospiraceae bacterium]